MKISPAEVVLFNTDGQTDMMMLIVAFQNVVNVPKKGAFHTVNMYFIINVLKIICSARKLKHTTKHLQDSLPVMQSAAYLPNQSTMQHSTMLISVRNSYLIKHISHQLALISSDTGSYLLNTHCNVSQNAFGPLGTSCCMFTLNKN
jgi:hypothetical protein